MKRKYLLVCFSVLFLMLLLWNVLRIFAVPYFIESRKKIFENYITIKSYELDEGYGILVDEPGSITRYIIYSYDREILLKYGVKPVEIQDIHSILGTPLEEVEKQYGAFHPDTGSGFFIPTYITRDGHLIKMWTGNNDIIDQVTKIDIFSNETVEWYSLSSVSDKSSP